MKCSTIQRKMLTEDMLQPLLQQMFKMASYSTDTSPEMSPLISRFIDNCLLYDRQDRGLCLSFCCTFFHRSVSSKSSNSYIL